MARDGNGNLKRRVWRWHFLAGLMVAPFGILLALTGAAYLFKPQVDAFTESRINSRAAESISQAPLPADDLVAAARAVHPEAAFQRLTLATSASDRTVEVELLVDGRPRLLWVDRFTGAVLEDADKGLLPMEFVKNIHGNLFAGNGGSLVVELMASWMIVLVITGLYLWWPRGAVWWRVFLPSLGGLRSRERFRRLHGAAGAWIGGMVLILLLSGLPWTQVWGGAFSRVQGAMGWDGPGQEWFVTLESGDPHHAHHGGMGDGLSLWERSAGDEGAVTLQSADPAPGVRPVPLRRIVAIVEAERLSNPVEIQPPTGSNGVWTVRSMVQDRPGRVTVHYDRWTAREIMRIGFADYHPVQRVASYGIALHEGQLFGWANQALGVVAALGVVFISLTGAVMWWKRRPEGALGVPPLPADRRLAGGVVALILALGAFLPMMGMSLLVMLMLDMAWLGGRRMVARG